MISRWIDRTYWEDLQLLIGQRRLLQKLLYSRLAEFKKNSGLRFASPFLSMLLHITLLGTIMGVVFGENMQTFLPYFGISFCVWQSISTFISESSHLNSATSRYLLFNGVSGLIFCGINVYQLVVFGVIRFAAVVAALVVVDAGILLDANWLCFVLGYILFIVVLFFWAVPLSCFFDSFRIFNSFLPQMLLALNLITPIFWPTGKLVNYSWVYEYNPIYHVIEIIRQPLLTGVWPVRSIVVVAIIAFIGFVLSNLLYRKNKELIVFRWLS